MTGVDLEQLEPAPAPDAKIRRDRWGRYLLPHPETGEEQAWTRATTLAGTLADRFALEQWDQRNIVVGIGARQDLYAQAAACTPDDTKTLNGIVVQAKEASKSKAGANLGTALHRFTERLDAGELDPAQVPDPWRADVQAYADAMSAAGIAVVDGWLERVLLVPEIDVAGTTDRLCNAMEWQLPRIGDLKTAKDVLRYGMVEIALQLAIYAHASHWFDPQTGQLHEMPLVDRDAAIVMHLPVGQATCTLYEVDIAAGWEAVQLALAVRNWRKRKDLAAIIPAVGESTTGNHRQRQTPSGPSEQALSRGTGDQPAARSAEAVTSAEGKPAAGPTLAATAERVQWVRARVAAIVTTLDGHPLPRPWPGGVPTFKAADAAGHRHTDAEIDQVVAWCNELEAILQVPFGAPDPSTLRPVGAPAPVEPSPPPTAPPARDTTWADKGRALRELVEDEDLFRACADVARCADVQMTREGYLCLEAVVGQVAKPVGEIGAVVAAYGAHSVRVVPSDEAAARMAEAAGGKAHALHRAKRLIKRLDLQIPSPRSLAAAAADPLLAALVAAGHGVANPDDATPTNSNSDNQESEQR